MASPCCRRVRVSGPTAVQTTLFQVVSVVPSNQQLGIFFLSVSAPALWVGGGVVFFLRYCVRVVLVCLGLVSRKGSVSEKDAAVAVFFGSSFSLSVSCPNKDNQISKETRAE